MRACLLVLIAACSSPSRETPHNTAAPVPQPPPDAPLATSSPDAEPQMCLDLDHCNAAKHCLEVCYQRNHPNGPADDRCRQGCFENYCPRIVCPAAATAAP